MRMAVHNPSCQLTFPPRTRRSNTFSTEYSSVSCGSGESPFLLIVSLLMPASAQKVLLSTLTMKAPPQMFGYVEYSQFTTKILWIFSPWSNQCNNGILRDALKVIFRENILFYTQKNTLFLIRSSVSLRRRRKYSECRMTILAEIH